MPSQKKHRERLAIDVGREGKLLVGDSKEEEDKEDKRTKTRNYLERNVLDGRGKGNEGTKKTQKENRERKEKGKRSQSSMNDKPK